MHYATRKKAHRMRQHLRLHSTGHTQCIFIHSFVRKHIAIWIFHSFQLPSYFDIYTLVVDVACALHAIQYRSTHRATAVIVAIVHAIQIAMQPKISICVCVSRALCFVFLFSFFFCVFRSIFKFGFRCLFPFAFAAVFCECYFNM